VVIAIIGILVSLGAGVVLRFFGTQQEINTKQTLKTLQNKLMQQYNAVILAAMERNQGSWAAKRAL
jgi:type II secretory pathway pseudopilin PulG